MLVMYKEIAFRAENVEEIRVIESTIGSRSNARKNYTVRVVMLPVNNAPCSIYSWDFDEDSVGAYTTALNLKEMVNNAIIAAVRGEW